jgi:hypothetical protein
MSNKLEHHLRLVRTTSRNFAASELMLSNINAKLESSDGSQSSVTTAYIPVACEKPLDNWNVFFWIIRPLNVSVE